MSSDHYVRVKVQIVGKAKSDKVTTKTVTEVSSNQHDKKRPFLLWHKMEHALIRCEERAKGRKG